MPSSKSRGEETALIGSTRGTGDPARTAIRMRRQRIHHELERPMNPHAHTVQRMVGSQLAAGRAVATSGDDTGVTVKGWLNRSTTTGTFADAIAALVLHPM